LLGARLEEGPAHLPGHPKDVDRAVFVRVLRISALTALGLEFGSLLPKGIGDIFEKDESQHHVLVLGSIHSGSQGVGCAPEFRLEAEIAT